MPNWRCLGWLTNSERAKKSEIEELETKPGVKPADSSKPKLVNMWPPSRPIPSVLLCRPKQARIPPTPLSGSSNLNHALQTLHHLMQTTPITPNHSPTCPPQTHLNLLNLSSLLFCSSVGERFLLLSQANLSLSTLYLSPSDTWIT